MLTSDLTVEDRVLELGCGLGATCSTIAAAGVDYVVGVDFNRRALAQARNLPMRNNLALIASDVTALPFSDNSFTVAVAEGLLTTLENVHDRVACLKEAARVLAPNGRIWIIDFIQNWHLDHYRQRYMNGLQEGLDLGSFEVRDEISGKSIYVAHHYSEREIATLLHGRGFSIDHFEYRRVKTYHGNIIYGVLLRGRISGEKGR